jgi:hypothetical protein
LIDKANLVGLGALPLFLISLRHHQINQDATAITSFISSPLNDPRAGGLDLRRKGKSTQNTKTDLKKLQMKLNYHHGSWLVFMSCSQGRKAWVRLLDWNN